MSCVAGARIGARSVGPARGAARRRSPRALALWVLVTLAWTFYAALSRAAPNALDPASSATLAVLDAGTLAHDTLNRETPRRAMASFLKEAREGDYETAAQYLDLRSMPEPLRERSGPDLAQKLAYVLEHGRRRLDLAKLPDLPEGDPTAKPAGVAVATTLYAGEDPIPVSLDHVRFPDGIERWLIARSTVDAIPTLDAVLGPRPIGIPIPASLTRTFLGNEAWQWLGIALSVLLAYVIARAGAATIVRAAKYFTLRAHGRADDEIVEAARRPLRMVLGSLVFRILIEPLQLTAGLVEIGEHATYTFLVIGVAWLLLRALGVATVWLDAQASGDGTDLVRGRRMRTQATILRRVASITIGIVAGAFVLIQFEFVRSVGVSLLASAGVASVVFGFAAQRSLGAIVAGIQFSFAQPVRMGDQVVVEGEFGEIEAIYLTYAVIRIWDKRRLVLPVTYFLEKPFQNWTRSGTELLGTVLLKVDYGTPTEPLRAELERLCKADPRWDKQTCGLQVTDSDASTVTVRALVSASNAGNLFDLRCNLREGLLAFLRSWESGKYLPRGRNTSV